MPINIAQRWKPFTHLPGTQVILPLSTLKMQIFPATIYITDICKADEQPIASLRLNTGGLVEKFTIQSDLERGRLRVWGESPKGYFRYRLEASAPNAYFFTWEKQPAGLEIEGVEMGFKEALAPPKATTANLSFGIHKAQDWQLIDRRLDLAEILPLWLRLGQWTPLPGGHTPLPHLTGVREAIEKGEPEVALAQLRELYLTCFQGMLCPDLCDKSDLGVSPLPFPASSSPLGLLREGAELIQRMLIHHSKEEAHILPTLPKSFHCGRLTNLQLPIGRIDLEWSKKKIGRLFFTPRQETSLKFLFTKNIRSCRLKRSISPSESLFKCGESVTFISQICYQFDRFES